MDKKNLNEELKKLDLEKREIESADSDKNSLDSIERVKVLSPGQLVFKRFIRNKLAIVGSITLIVMFVFAFLCPLVYPYSQTQLFYKYGKVQVNYAQASQRTDYSLFLLDQKTKIDSDVKLNVDATISKMEADKSQSTDLVSKEGNSYTISKLKDGIYSLLATQNQDIAKLAGSTPFATYNSFLKDLKFEAGQNADAGFVAALDAAASSSATTFSYEGKDYTLQALKKGTYTVLLNESGVTYADGVTPLGADFEAAVAANEKNSSFVYNGITYFLTNDGSSTQIYTKGSETQIAYLSTYDFLNVSKTKNLTNDFKNAAFASYVSGEPFTIGNDTYEIKQRKENKDIFEIFNKKDEKTPYAAFSSLIVKAYDGTDSLSYDYILKTHSVVEQMQKDGKDDGSFDWKIPQLNKDGKYVVDKKGNTINSKTMMGVERKEQGYVISCNQVTYLIDIYAKPDLKHLIGTDGDGMDVLARMMYGGRVSLMVCFVVILIEYILGIILGGIAGYFGGWVDNLIMRAVDVFYCIPSMPILIIIGALMDAMKINPFIRVIWLMVVLGVLGWASVARLVRGQILSLREQEFMIATEAIGLKTSKRIFRHLVPNVMPQLIVTASTALGDIIITESTLSFLGLGIKHPLASWGTMINSVTASSETMIMYTYIWIPVGILICLTVIAFNFVGDGLRDAFDPKMKR